MICPAAASAKEPPPTGGVSGLWGIMREPDNQDALRFLINVSKVVRKTSVTPYG